MVLQETYEIQDCWVYGIDTTKFIIPSSTTFSSNGEYITATTDTNGEKIVYLDKEVTNSDNWIFETEVAQIGTGQSLAVVWNDNSFFGGQSNGDYAVVYSYMSSRAEQSISPQIGDKWIVRRENGVTTVSLNDTVIQSLTISHKSTFKVGYFINRGRTQYYKNIKFKAL